MSRRTSEFDWSKTPLGPEVGWPRSLKIAVRIMLDSRYAMWLGWGPEFTFFYNDAYARMTLGPKHPRALGRPTKEVWPEIWDDVATRAHSVVRTGEATWDESLLLFLERNGFPEETYHTFSYSPVPNDEGGIGGLLCVVAEDTERTIGERRLRTLRELASRTNEQAKSAEEACRTAARTLAENPRDLPFVLIYLLDTGAKTARLAAFTGLLESSSAAPARLDLVDANERGSVWPFKQVLESAKAQVVADLNKRFPSLECGPWPEPPREAVVLPLAKPGQSRPAGFVVIGASARRPFDSGYLGFFGLVAGQVATAVANAQAYEEERKRLESLAELDRAKTAFFSNVSHEFRTPLTLMLGPVEDCLASAACEAITVNRQELEVVHRNGLRLQKLVNSLLDFSRIEAGRVQASFEPTDLATYTAELASNFRSACERADLKLEVDCPPLDEPIYIDHEMWEKIVLNLLSNAFKFTLHGRIEVALHRKGPAVELSVRDTGTGIPADQLPHLFERFHRVEGTRGRTQEGSGIGLALVRELTLLHGGNVRVDSEAGKGSTFTVSIPVGTAHLPQSRIRAARSLNSTALVADSFVEEALRWLPDSLDQGGSAAQSSDNREFANKLSDGAGERPRILLADDNADMRDYIRRLLGSLYEVTAVSDGLAARDAARRSVPALVLSDVMMPGLDGFELLSELRANPHTQAVPVILLSARAGEEARVEGLQASADDYLTKPFSAKELLARVSSALQIARLRREALDRERELLARVEVQRNQLQVTLSSIGDAVIATDVEGHVIFMNPVAEALTGWRQEEALGAKLEKVFHIVNEQSRLEAENPVEKVLREGAIVGLANHTVLIARGGSEKPIDDSAAPIRDEADKLQGVVLVFRDISEKKRVEEEIRRAGELSRTILESISDAFCALDREWRFTYANRQAEVLMGRSRDELIGRDHWEVYPDTLGTVIEESFRRALAESVTVKIEHSYRPHGRWYEINAYPSQEGLSIYFRDVSERKRAEAALRDNERRFRQLADAMPQIVWTANPDGIIDYLNRRWMEFTGLPETVSNEGWTHILHPEDAPLASERWAASRRSGDLFEMETRLFDRSQQTYRWHLVRTVSIRDESGSIVRWFGTGTDIDAQKRSEESSRYLAEASAALANVVDYESTLQKVANLAVPYFADWSAVDVLNENGTLRRLAVAHKDPAKINLIHEIAREYPQNPDSPTGALAVLRRREPVSVSEITDEMLVKGARDERHLQLIRSLGLKSYICVPLIVSGNSFGVLTFATAESHRRYAEADLSLAMDLANRASVAIENTQLYSALRETDRRKDEFLATLAHELRNPLAPIRNSLQILKMPRLDPETVERSREMMERQVHHLVRLVDDLMDVSRVMRGKIELRREQIELAAVCARAVETVQPLIDALGHQLIVDLPSASLLLDADPVRLTQIVGNLLTNAAKYTEPNGRIWLTAAKDADMAVLRVRDTGIGIEPTMLSRIFDLFVQVDQASTKAQGGLGIGLTLVKNLVEMHNGAIEATSRGLGKGSEFIVRLPIFPQSSEAPQGQKAGRQNGDAATVSGFRLLVVDDNQDAANSLGMLLRLQGHEVRVVYSGMAALEETKSYTPDMVFMDIGMPGMDGYEVARRLRLQPSLERMVITALTGWGQQEDRRRSKEAGFNHHLVKPPEPKTLDELLASLRRSGF